jgi:hypothetical protein
MSSSKLDTSGVFGPVTVVAHQAQLTLSAETVRVRKNGIEFRTAKPIPTYNEMTVEMQSREDAKIVRFTGVVVACDGNRHTGYHVSMVFTSLSRQSQERLQTLASVRLA